MLPQFDNFLTASLFLWAENRLTSVGQAYIPSVTTKLYYTVDPSLPSSYVSYNSPFKQWVSDSGIVGVNIIDSISGGVFSSPLTRASGLIVDYNNGRILLPSSYGKNLQLTGSACLKEINVYGVNENEDPLLTANKYFRNPRYIGTPTSGIAPNVICTPALFVNTLAGSSTPFSFGGLDDTKTTFTLTALVESDYQLKAVLSLFRDARYQYIPLVGPAQWPLNQLGDFKNGTGYSYQNLIEQYGTPGNLILIDNVYTSKISDSTKLNPNLFAGLIDLEVSFVRQPQ